MVLNRFEFLLMNNPIRSAIQRHFEAQKFLRMGRPLPGARVLEIGCGRGVGVGLILDVFGAASVDAFDLDPRMMALAQRRLASRGPRVRLWIGDAAAINAPNDYYDAVFDFGIIHHVPDWRNVLLEVHRVLRPAGLLFAEEPDAKVINHPLMRHLCDHPLENRFSVADFRSALNAAGLVPLREEQLWRAAVWFVAEKPATPQPNC